MSLSPMSDKINLFKINLLRGFLANTEIHVVVFRHRG